MIKKIIILLKKYIVLKDKILEYLKNRCNRKVGDIHDKSKKKKELIKKKKIINFNNKFKVKKYEEKKYNIALTSKALENRNVKNVGRENVTFDLYFKDSASGHYYLMELTITRSYEFVEMIKKW